MKKIDENTKVTLTLGQIKRLVKEAAENSDFEIKDGVLIKYRGKDRNIYIPNGVTVVGNGEDPIVDGRRKIISIVCPDSVITISRHAMAWQRSLKTVEFGNSLREIGESAFLGCGMSSIIIPDSVKKIEENAFEYCHELTTVKLPKSLRKIDTLFAFMNTPFAESKNIRPGVLKKGEKEAFDELFKKGAKEAFDYIAEHIDDFTEYDWGMNRVQVHLVFKEFTRRLVAEPYGFSFMNLKHAHGIGNNNEWDVVKKDKKIGTFYCTDDMFGGVRTGITIDGRIVDKREF